MFITRMALDINRAETVFLLHHADDLRRAVLSAFAGGNLMPLFRIDHIGSREWLVLLSALRPTLFALHERYGYLGVFPSWETFDYDETLEQAEQGTVWHFELLACPAEGVDHPSPMLADPDRLRAWLDAQGEENGFAVRNAEVMSSIWRPQAHALMLHVRWKGLLCVTDPERFEWGVSRGIGQGKEEGLGLMTIARNLTYWED